MDLGLPDGSGEELIGVLRAANPRAVALVPPPGEKERVVELQRATFDGVREWDTGNKLPSFLGESETEPHQVRAAYSAADYETLTAIKTTYDPDNVFRINHNIPPNARASIGSQGERVGAEAALDTKPGASSRSRYGVGDDALRSTGD